MWVESETMSEDLGLSLLFMGRIKIRGKVLIGRVELEFSS